MPNTADGDADASGGESVEVSIEDPDRKPVGKWLLGAAAAGTACAVTMGAMARPDISPERLRMRYTNEASAFVAVDGMEVHYRDEGPRDAPVLLCLHGTFSSLHVYDGWAKELSDRVRVVRLDLPGFGLTGPHPEGEHTIDGTVEFLDRFMERVGIDAATVVGNSRGGSIAWRFALAHPDRVRALVLADSNGYPLEESPWFYTLPDTPAYHVLRHVTPRALVRYGITHIYGDPGKVTDEQVRLYHELLLREGNREALRDMELPPPADRPRDIRKIDVPTLLLWGELDEWVPPRNGRRFERDIEDSELVVYDGVGHVPVEEAPVRTAGDVEVFLEERVAPAVD